MKKLLCLLGPAGSGKTTLAGELQDRTGIEEVVSYTTRDMREGEIEGVTYYYVSEEEFEKLDKIEEVKYSGNRYAFTKDEIDKKLADNSIVYLIIDRDGIEQLQERFDKEIIEVVYIFSSVAECFKRVSQRDGLWQAIKRITRNTVFGEFSNHKFADFIIRNKDNKFDYAINQLKSIYKYFN